MVWEGTGMEPRRVQLRASWLASTTLSLVPTISSVAPRFLEWTIEFIDGLGLTTSEREMIYEKNARQIPRSRWLGVRLPDSRVRS